MLEPSRLAAWKAAIDRVRAHYVRVHGRKPRLLRPTRYTEKIQWRKLFDLNPAYPVLSDKWAAREFIAGRVGREMLIPVLWLGDDPDAVPLDTLDPPYVIKATHASGHVLRVRNRADLDVTAARAMFRTWLGYCHATQWDEPGYRPVPRRLIVERMLQEVDGGPPLERKLFVFGGRVRFVLSVVVDHEGKRQATMYDLDWNPQVWRTDVPLIDGPLPRPQDLPKLIEVAERLGHGFDHVRVDLYECRGRILAGELTLYSWTGLITLDPGDGDHKLGACWKLERPAWRAIKTLLWQPKDIQVQQVTPAG